MWIEAFCGYPFNRCRLTCEGNVAFCCFMRPSPIQSNAEAYIGNILETSFDEVWFGEIAEAIRKDTIEGKLHERCQTPACPYRGTGHLTKKKIVYNEYPNFLEIDLPNTHCNVGGLNPGPDSPACIMCERSSPHFKPEQDRLFDVLERVKNIVPNLSHIHIQGIAEPFYETRKSGFLLFDVLDALDFDAHAQRITLSLTTNGTLFKRSTRQEYLRRAPHSITTFSIDAANPETFKTIRIFDCLDKVLTNLYDFDTERDPQRQFLRINNNINILNVHEVLDMVEIGRKAHVDMIEFNPTDGHNRGILVSDENCGLFRKAQMDITEACQRYGIVCLFPRPLDQGFTDRLIQLTL